MVKQLREKQDKFFKYYLIVSIPLVILDILTIPLIKAYIFNNFGLVFYTITTIGVNLLSLGYLILSIYALIKFIKNRFHTSTLVIPIIEIFTSFVSLLIIFVNWFIVNLATFFIYFIYLGILIDIFIIFFAIYLLKKEW